MIRQLSILILLILGAGHSYAQQLQSKSFNSVFKDLKSGSFNGTSNGVLFVKQNKADLTLDFQGTAANLSINADLDQMYDISVKTYSGHTTSGKTSVKYSTYNMANSLEIKLSDVTYSINFIDGASDETIGGLNWYYKAEKGTEYLVLQVEQEITLSNFYSLATASAGNKPDLETIKKQEQKLVLLPHSTLTFAIRR